MAEGTEVGTAYVSITPSAAGFAAELERQVTGQASLTGQRAGQAIASGVVGQTSGMATKIAGVFAAIGAGQFLRGAVAEAEDAARVGRLTESVIRSTGSAAGVTADQVEKLAASLSKTAAVDDEVIQSAANVMLTFTRVSGQVFPQAVSAAIDLSAALGTDLQSAVVQLGKALNDPTQGLLALRRSGVSFTEAQQEQIKALQAGGDLLGAQKIILAEVNKEFGGAAAAGATATARLNVAVGNLQESLGAALLPAVSLAADALTGLVGGFTAMPGPIQATAGALTLFAGASLAVGLLAPKLRAARLELEGLGLAGTRANTALGLISKAAFTLVGIIGSINFADKIAGVEGLDKQITKLARTTDEDLNQAFHDTNNEMRGWDLFQAVGISKRHDEFETFAEIVDQGNFALAQRIIASETDLEVRGRLQAAYDTAIGQTRQLNTDQRLSAEIIGGVGDAVDTTAAKVKAATEKWHDFRDTLEGIVESDFSKQLASNLTSALNPMQKFVVGAGQNIAALTDTVTSAQAELARAQVDLDKVQGSGTAAEIARFRGTAADIDAARARVTQAGRRLGEAQKELADAQKSPLTSLTENLRSNLSVLNTWTDNITKIQNKLGGTQGGELAKHLAALGPEAAAAAAEAVGVSPAQLANLESLFDQADAKIAEAASGAFELNIDQAARPGEKLADIIAARYRATLTPKFTEATLAALDEATSAILAAEGGRGQRSGAAGPGGGTPPGPASVGPAPPAGPPAPTVPLVDLPGYSFGFGAPAPQITIPFQVTTDADPRQIAGEVGDAIAWRLAPRATPVG